MPDERSDPDQASLVGFTAFQPARDTATRALWLSPVIQEIARRLQTDDRLLEVAERVAQGRGTEAQRQYFHNLLEALTRQYGQGQPGFTPLDPGAAGSNPSRSSRPLGETGAVLTGAAVGLNVQALHTEIERLKREASTLEALAREVIERETRGNGLRESEALAAAREMTNAGVSRVPEGRRDAAENSTRELTERERRHEDVEEQLRRIRETVSTLAVQQESTLEFSTLISRPTLDLCLRSMEDIAALLLGQIKGARGDLKKDEDPRGRRNTEVKLE